LKRLGGQLKKNKIAVDIVNFGEGCAEENRALLETFHASVNNHDNSFFVTLPPGEHMLSQMIASTPIVRGTDAGPAGDGGSAGPAASTFDEYGGVDPNVDPELAMALRMSLESAENERKAREGPSATPAAPAAAAPVATAAAANPDAMDVEDDMDEDLRAAIALSLSSAQPSSPPAPAKEPADAMDVDEDDDLAAALSLSKQTAASDAAKDSKKEDEKGGEVDASYMESVLLNLPGMDPNDPEVQAMLKSMKEEEEKKKQEKK
jgi:26S proteasome regulatory subunit N10